MLTVFDRWTQPLIRYEISDMVRPLEGSCPCGRPLRLIAAIEGRAEEVLSFPGADGAAADVHPNVFHRIFDTVNVGGWQIVQKEDALEVSLTGISNGFSRYHHPNSAPARLGSGRDTCTAPALDISR